MWYLKEVGSSFDDNSVSVVNTGGFSESDILVWYELSRGDTLVNYYPLYNQLSSISSLGSGATTSVAFPTGWIPLDRGEYFVSYRTELSGDEVAQDDTLMGMLFAERDLLHSAWAASAPTCDGFINPGEWDDACVYDLTKFYLNPRTVDCPLCYDSNAVFVYIKNDSSYLYFALDVVKDTSDSVGDWTIIGIDDDANERFNSDYSEGRYELRNAPGAGTDSLIFWPFRSYSTFPYEVEDIGIGTLLAFQFGHRENNGHQQIEMALFFGVSMSFYLNSGPGDTIMAYLGYVDSEDTCTLESGIGENTVGYWPFQAIFDFYPTLLGKIYLSDVPQVPGKPVLIFPPNGTQGAVNQAFLWESVARATSYQLQIDYDSNFVQPLIKDTTVMTNGCLVSDLPGSMIWWRVRGINSYGSGSWSDSAKYTDVEYPTDETDVVDHFSLSQNYPNPFNPYTTIPFTVHGKREAENGPFHATLNIYNIMGQRVRTLVDDVKLPGEHKVNWDGKDDKGNSVSSGIYFYKLKVGDFSKVKKMLLIK